MTTRFSMGLLAISAGAFYACGSSGPAIGGGGAGAGGSHAGGSAAAGKGAAGVGGAAAAAGNGAGGSLGGGGIPGGATTCTPGVQGSAIVDCGYPYASTNPLTSVTFSESEVLRAIEPSGGAPLATVRVFYNDEHALTLGVRQVVVTGGASSMTDYAVSPLATDPGSVVDAKTGSNVLAGPQSGLDVSLRPMWPALFITDITADPTSRSGDWQEGGVPRSPNAIFGTWKAAVRTVDTSMTPNLIMITPDADPKKNAWVLGGGDPVPPGLTNQGFGAEVRWDLALTPGHSYRIQAMVHDGAQNKAGGDSGEACVIFCAGGAGGTGGGYVPPPTMCGKNVEACGQGGIDPKLCPAATICANGCCLPIIP
ncbi:MAG: hypothetical protein JWM82_3103 [Myxococcales bacterium]|nr:hypothetical protein [Myxococcales bacterium]